MPGPWDKYAAPSGGGDGPWAKYSTPKAPTAQLEAPAEEPGILSKVGSAISNSPLVGGLDMVASGIRGAVSRIPAGLAGLATGAVNTGAEALGKQAPLPPAADVVHGIENWAATPASASGAQGQEYVGKTVQPLLDKASKGLGQAGQAVGGDVGERVAQALPAVADAATTVIPGVNALKSAAAVGRGAAGSLVEGAAKPVVGVGNDAITTGRSVGLKFTPGAVESRNPGAALEGEIPQSFAVDANDRRAINLHNQQRITELAQDQIGAQGPLSKGTYDAAKKPHFATYDQTGKTLQGNLTGSDDFKEALEGRIADTTQNALKGGVAQQAKRVLNAATSGNLNGPQMVKDISWFRQNGGSSVARLLENEMETQLAGANAGQQLEKFRNARTSLAQINNLQEATEGGQINAAKLAKIDQKNPNLLTGNLKLIAQSAAAAPQDFRLPSGVKPGSSPLSKPTVASAAAAAGKYAAKKLAPGKFDVTSDAFQNRFGRQGTPTELSYQRDLGKRPAPPSQRFELESPQGSVGMEPAQRELVLPPGLEPRPQYDLAPSEGEVGVRPVQLGMQIAQGRPLEERQLALIPSEGTIEPHQPSLLGHPETPEGGYLKKAPRGKKRGKD